MKTAALVFAFVSVAQIALGTTGLLPFGKLEVLESLAVGNLHGSMGLLGALFFVVAMLGRVQSGRGRR